MALLLEATGLRVIFTIAREIQELADSAERNKEKCRLLKDRVAIIIPFVTEIEKQWTPDKATECMLGNLHAALNDGKELLESCQEKRIWSLVFRTKKKASKLDAVHVRISNIMEQFHLANMLLVVNVNKERFFMTVLDKLLGYGGFRRSPQKIRGSVSIPYVLAGLGMHASRDASPSPTSHGGNKASSSARGDSIAMEVASLTDGVLKEARQLQQTGDEIQQLVKLVQLVRDLVQDPQYSQVLRDPKRKPMLDGLKGDLQEASNTVIWHSRKQQHPHSKLKRSLTCGSDGSDDLDYVLKVAFKIEYYVQVLPVIAIRQICNQQNLNA